MSLYKHKDRLLREWAQYIIQAAHAGHLDKRGQTLAIGRVITVAGPRAGALEIHVGQNTAHLNDAGRLLKALASDDAAVLRQLVPWEFAGDPVCFMHGRYVRVEAGWSGQLAESMIRLTNVGQYPRLNGRWVAGKNEHGQTVTLGLGDSTPHFLLGGQTGAGKSVGMLAAICQLGQDPSNKIVLIDGKYGHDLSKVQHIPTRVGPLVIEKEDGLSALSWVIQDMKRRYQRKIEQRPDPTRLIVMWDEPQEWLKESNALVAITRELLAKGRAASVHLVLSTQHPTVDVFGDSSSKRNLAGRIALRVADAEASRVVVGQSQPRADHLLGAGDSYLVTPGATHRAQLVYVDQGDFDALPEGEPVLEAWPEFHAEDLGQPLPSSFDGTEVALSLVAAADNKGRPTLRKWIQEATGSAPGSPRAQRLLELGRDAYQVLAQRGYGVSRIN